MIARVFRSGVALFLAVGLAGCDDCWPDQQGYRTVETVTGQVSGPAALGLPAAVQRGPRESVPLNCTQGGAPCSVGPSLRAPLADGLQLMIDADAQPVGIAEVTLSPGTWVHARISQPGSRDGETLELRTGTMRLARWHDRVDVFVNMVLARPTGDDVTVDATLASALQSECLGD